jgi:hypothetical protein
MDLHIFDQRLRQAAASALGFAREMVAETLPDSLVFRVYPNQSCDGAPLVDDEENFPEETLPSEEFLGPWDAEQAVAYLWRFGKVPEWIDVGVEAVENARTRIGLRCCGRFAEKEHLLYHRQEGLPPFAIKSPSLPPGWRSVEESGPFEIRTP